MIEALAAAEPLENPGVEVCTAVERTDVMTGDRNRRMFLYYQLIGSIQKAERIDIIVSFLMESGVRMLLKELNLSIDRGTKVLAFSTVTINARISR